MCLEIYLTLHVVCQKIRYFIRATCLTNFTILDLIPLRNTFYVSTSESQTAVRIRYHILVVCIALLTDLNNEYKENCFKRYQNFLTIMCSLD
jgi:hypothetical protein